ncbi:MAG: 2-oxo acid dehydrogenase subunit E2, partial [Marinobacterium sp.]|nr:2-oxo acid dehydrogenase subunit E2 [Marinobacterium sp.]
QAMARTATTEVPIRGLRRVIAQKMVAAKRSIPHYAYVEEIDVTALEELRQHLNENRKPDQPKLTLLPFIMQALTKVLPEFPACNARYDEEREVLTQYAPVHIGIATMTDKGLMVPVVRHTEALDIWQSATELSRLSAAARDGSARGDELSGSTVTITSLGAIGGIVTTPVINAPETAIVGVNKLQEKPVVHNGETVVRKMMNLSSSFDHRIVDGYDAALMVQALKRLLENPASIFV